MAFCATLLLIMSQRVKGQKIGDYVVTFSLHRDGPVETFRVKNSAGTNFFLKLINLGKISSIFVGNDHKLIEESIVKTIHHENLISLHDSFSVILDGEKYRALVFEYISGVTLEQYLETESYLSVKEAKQIILSLLEGVSYLHNQHVPITHNNLTVESVMLDLTAVPPTPKIVDFSCADFFEKSEAKPNQLGKNPFYLAPEIFDKKISSSSDLYSIGAIFYHLIFGVPPFLLKITESTTGQEIINSIVDKKQHPLEISKDNTIELDNAITQILVKSMNPDSNARYQTAEEMIHDLRMSTVTKTAPKQETLIKSEQTKAEKVSGGFSDVAGMDELKAQLQSDVIDILNNPERAQSLGLSLPNGLFFYGPPGCGKTYFAEKFAEEVGCNYLYIKCSDVASPYIHGGQGKIADIFKEAREKAPSILFFDEIDSMLTDRSKQTNVSESGEVNEFLAQLNNCGKDGVIVIGATNKPNQVDEAALRAGRLEYKYYIPPPDQVTRKAIFELNLKNRLVSDAIDFEVLAQMTNGFISADIKLIVDKAARFVFRNNNENITQKVLEDVIANSKPSLSEKSLKEHESIRQAFENEVTEKKRRPIGFY